MDNDITKLKIDTDLDEETVAGIMDALNKMEFSKLMHFEVVSIKQGEVVATHTMSPELVNHVGSVHGGVLYSLSDTFAGVAAATYGKSVVTVNSHYEFFRPAYDETCICKSYVVKAGSNLVRVNSDIYDTKDNLLCSGLFTYFTIDNDAYMTQK